MNDIVARYNILVDEDAIRQAYPDRSVDEHVRIFTSHFETLLSFIKGIDGIVEKGQVIVSLADEPDMDYWLQRNNFFVDAGIRAEKVKNGLSATAKPEVRVA